MTYIPNVSSNQDENNSYSASASSGSFSFIGVSTNTNGYNAVIITIHSSIDSVSSGLKIYMNDEGETPTVYFSDTFIANTNYTKSFLISKKYYHVTYQSATISSAKTLNISSRLCTDIPESTMNRNLCGNFDFNVENTLDAFGKLRVTMPNTLLEVRFPGQTNGTDDFLNNDMVICSDISGSYTGTYNNAALKLGGTGKGWYISQSRKFCVYQPGKSLLFMASGILCPCDSNFTAYVSGYTGRIGYYSNNHLMNSNNSHPYNGLYFEYNESGAAICMVNLGTITTVTQSNWNLDKMDGTGPCAMTLDFKKAQLMVIDMEWLGVGRVRFGFYAYGRIHYCHQITNINALITPYISDINLPIRYELVNESTVTSTPAYIMQICSTVISEGGYNPIGRQFTTSSGTTPVAVNSKGVETAILALRGSENATLSQNNNFHTNIVPNSVSMGCSNNNSLFMLKVRLYPGEHSNSVTSTNWYEISGNELSTYANKSAAQYAVGSNITFNASNSLILNCSYFYSNVSSQVSDLSKAFNDQTVHLTSNISGKSDVLLVTATNLSNNNTDVYVSLGWGESG